MITTGRAPRILVNPEQCPLCGAANGCAMAAGARSAESCWCMTAPIPAAVLESIPPDTRGLACVCARCAGAVPRGIWPTIASILRDRLARVRRDK